MPVGTMKTEYTEYTEHNRFTKDKHVLTVGFIAEHLVP
jgi:hypothetical protein